MSGRTGSGARSVHKKCFACGHERACHMRGRCGGGSLERPCYCKKFKGEKKDRRH